MNVLLIGGMDYVGIGQKDRLANTCRLSLGIIEVHRGAYMGRDDMVRFKDSYGLSPYERR
jgi:hypothetical protein